MRYAACAAGRSHSTTQPSRPSHGHSMPLRAAAAGMDLIISAICNATFCESVYDNPRVDKILTNHQKQIIQLTNEINGKHLRIGTFNNRPLSWYEKHENGTITGHGVAFTIVDILRKRFNFTYEVVVPTTNYEIGGDEPDESLIGLVVHNRVDMAAAFISSVDKYRSMVSFSTDIDEGVWMMMLRRPKESAAGSGLLAPFEANVWYLILAAVASYGPCITLLTRLRSRLVRDRERDIPLSPSVWFVYGAFIKQGTTLAPEANTTRVLFATWWIFVILLSAFYTANLTAFLTLSKFTLDIESPQDLFKRNYRWLAAQGSHVQFTVMDPGEELHYLGGMVSRGRAAFRAVGSDAEFLPAVRRGAVLVKEQTAIDRLLYGDYLRLVRAGVPEAERCTFVVAPNAFMTRLRAFAFPKNSTLHLLFNRVLTGLVEAGIVDFLEHSSLPSSKICPLDLQSKDRRLRNSDLMMTYMIMSAGLAAAVAVFIGEIVIKRCVKSKQDVKESSKRTSKRTKNGAPEEWSRPPPYEALFGDSGRYRRYSRYGIDARTERAVVNGTEYWVVGGPRPRLIPVRTPSALLYR